jgi:hypothetical protein
VEHASNDQEVVSKVTIEDLNFLIIIEDIFTLSMTKVKVVEIPQLTEDPLIKATSSLCAIARKEKDMAWPPIHIPLHRLP